MKKILALILALSMAFSLVSCGDEPEKEPIVPDDAIVEDVPQDAPIPEEAPKAEETPKTEDASKAEDNPASEPIFEERLPSGKTETEVEEYFKLNAQAFLAFVTDNYAKSSGSVCTGRLAAVGNSVTVDVCIGSLVDVTEETKASLREAYSTFGDMYDQLFQDLKRDVPSLESMTINLCEEDGDVIVAMKHGK